MAGFSELVKTFEKAKGYIRDFFICGFRIRGDFQQKSSRTYDDERRRAESWLGGVLQYDDSVRGRQVFLSVDSSRIPENPLYQMYAAKSFTTNDIRLHFLLLDLLADGEARSLNAVMELLVTEYGAEFDPQTVRGKLREYAGEGLLTAEKRGNAMFYRLTETEKVLRLRENPALAEAVRFFAADDAFGVIGAEMLHEAGLQNDIFLRKHNYIVHTLEDSILPVLLAAMEQKCTVTLRAYSARLDADDREGRAFEAVPMQIIGSLQTGRRYLAAYIPAEGRFHSFRLDYLGALRQGAVFPDYDRSYSEYLAMSRRVYGVSFGAPQGGADAEPLRLTVLADPETEPFILQRLEREKRCGILTQERAGQYTLTFDVIDPNEIMHWAKTLIGRIVSVEGGTAALRERFADDIRRMQAMYGGAAHDDLP